MGKYRCIENGQTIFLNINDTKDLSCYNEVGKLQQTFEKAFKNDTSNPAQTEQTRRDGHAVPTGRATQETGRNQQSPEARSIAWVNRHSFVGHDNSEECCSFHEPPHVSRKLGMFDGLHQHDQQCQAQNDDASVTQETKELTESTSFSSDQRYDSFIHHHRAISSVADLQENLESKHAFTMPVPGLSNMIAQSSSSGGLVRPVAVSSQPSPIRLPGFTPGASPGIPFSLPRHPLVPMPLPPLAVFTHPLHLLPVPRPALPYPWQLQHQLSTPVLHRLAGQLRANCPLHHATTAALTSTARLSASNPLLKRGRRPKRLKPPNTLPLIDVTPAESDVEEYPTTTKRTEANARERERVTLLNSGFEQLRQALPWSKRNGRRVSKVDTLRAAIAYIHYLEAILLGSDMPDVSPGTSLRISRGIVLDGSIKLCNSPSQAPAGLTRPLPVLPPRYPGALPPGCRFVSPPPLHPAPVSVVSSSHRAAAGLAASSGATPVPVALHLATSLPLHHHSPDQQVANQTLPHGASLECSPSYHSTALSWLINFSASTENLGVPAFIISPMETGSDIHRVPDCADQPTTDMLSRERHVT